MTWMQTCDTCEGLGVLTNGPCSECDGQGLVPHPHQPDDVAVLLANEDQLKAHLYREAEIAAYHRDTLVGLGFSEDVAEQMAGSYYQAHAWDDGP